MTAEKFLQTKARESCLFILIEKGVDPVRIEKVMEDYHQHKLVSDGDLESVSESKDHICGLQGYNGMIDPPCLACEERSNSR